MLKLRTAVAALLSAGFAASLVAAGCSSNSAHGVKQIVPTESSTAEQSSTSASCGNAIWEPANHEDCDLGPTDHVPQWFCTAKCVTSDLLLGAPVPEASSVERTLGAGRHPVAVGPSAIATAYVELDPAPSLYVSFTQLDGAPDYAASAPRVLLDPAAIANANPSVTALPNGTFAVAWTDTAIDEQDIALSIVNPVTGTATPRSHANSVTAGMQYDPDILTAGSSLVVAWTDESSSTTGPDVRYRAFDLSLNPASSDQTLATTSAAESSVSLATFGSGWAAAWRDEEADGERLQVRSSAGSTWTIGPYVAGAADDRPGLAALDSATLGVAYTQAPALVDGGVTPASSLRVATLTAAGASPSQWVLPTAVSATVAQDEAGLVMVAGVSPYLAWRTAGVPGSLAGDELWLKPLGWSNGVLSVAAPEMTMPRWSQHTVGDQRYPTMASKATGGASLVMAWVDLAEATGPGEATNDIVLENTPLPIQRNAGIPTDPTCATGQGYCNSACTSLQTDVNNCGTCGVACAAPSGGSATCTAGVCGVACPSGDDLCGGACVAVTSVLACGASCAVCLASPNASPGCDGYNCYPACLPNWADCDSNTLNGCETDVLTSAANCGGCGRPCPVVANGTPTCTASLCSLSCNAGFHMCGQQCVSNTSVNSCGSSCQMCPNGPPESSQSCDGTNCGITCAAGYHMCSNGLCNSNSAVATCGSSCTPCPNVPNGFAACNGTSCGFTCMNGALLCNGACVFPPNPFAPACP